MVACIVRSALVELFELFLRCLLNNNSVYSSTHSSHDTKKPTSRNSMYDYSFCRQWSASQTGESEVRVRRPAACQSATLEVVGRPSTIPVNRPNPPTDAPCIPCLQDQLRSWDMDSPFTFAACIHSTDQSYLAVNGVCILYSYNEAFLLT